MKLKFWKKNRKPDGVVIGIKIDAADMEAAFERMKADLEGGLISNLAKGGRYVRVEHFPQYVGMGHAPGNAPWVVTFNVDLADAQGLRYGNKGVEIINAVGLPGNPKFVELVAEDNGRAVVKSQDCPLPSTIEDLARTIEARATVILDEYRRFEAMGQVRKKAAK